MKVLTPSPATLKKYGLSVEEWQVILDRQGGVCGCCKQEPKKGRLCIDHFHVKKWKKMPPEQRKLYVRGLLCFRCNTTFLGRGATAERLQNGVNYLVRFDSVRPMDDTIWKGPNNDSNVKSRKNRILPNLQSQR